MTTFNIPRFMQQPVYCQGLNSCTQIKNLPLAFLICMIYELKRIKSISNYLTLIQTLAYERKCAPNSQIPSG